jgi:flagellar biosynthesis/type III secretory pathway M-ring protein FliF/YscJ
MKPQSKQPTRPQPTHNKNATTTPSPASSKHEIDAALQALTQFIQKDPKKAAKIFESWIDETAKNRQSPARKKAA